MYSLYSIGYRKVCVMLGSDLNKWVYEDLLRATLEPEDYQYHVRTHPKYIFIKPESLCNADPRWEILCHESKPKYVSFRNTKGVPGPRFQK